MVVPRNLVSWLEPAPPSHPSSAQQPRHWLEAAPPSLLQLASARWLGGAATARPGPCGHRPAQWSQTPDP